MPPPAVCFKTVWWVLVPGKLSPQMPDCPLCLGSALSACLVTPSKTPADTKLIPLRGRRDECLLGYHVHVLDVSALRPTDGHFS